MAKCGFCGATVLFGGVRDGELRFCNEKCHTKGLPLVVARQIPKGVVDRHAGEVHRGRCPRCQGNGPVDVHTSYRIYSAILYSSWASRPHVCCRSCGVKSQLGDTLFSLLLGWWGIPWGLLLIPLQVTRNLFALARGTDEVHPSDELRRLVSIDIAANALAQQQEGTA